jgi:hypothetical protein
VFSTDLDDFGGRQGDTHQALTQLALGEALDVLYWTVHPALFCRICMAIEIASNLPSFLSW